MQLHCSIHMDKCFQMTYGLVSVCVLATPGYIPPLANFDGDSTEGAVVHSSAAPPNKAKKGNHHHKIQYNQGSRLLQHPIPPPCPATVSITRTTLHVHLVLSAQIHQNQ